MNMKARTTAQLFLVIAPSLAFLLPFLPGSLPAATISWVGGSGDWSTAANWSGGQLPGTNDDVMIASASSITVTHSSGAHVVRSVQSEEAFTLSGGTLTVSNTVRVDNAPFTLSGGTLRAATVLPGTNGASVLVSSGTVDGVTMQAGIDVGNFYYEAFLTVTNGLVLGGTLQLGNSTNSYYGIVNFAGNQTLGGNGMVVFGSGTCNALRLGLAGTTLTIGPGITVAGQSGQIGYSTCYGGFQNVSVINQGTILASVTNASVVINANLTNSGTLSSLNSTLSLGGTNSLATLGTLQVSNSTVILTGTFINTNNTLWVNELGGTWVLNGGKIAGGSVVATNGAMLAVGDNGGTLDGVTINGLLDVNGGYSPDYSDRTLTVTNGLTLNGTMRLGNITNSPDYYYYYYGTVSFAGTQTLGGNGTIIFGENTCNSLRLSLANTTLTLGPGITVTGQSGQIGYSSCYGGPQNVSVLFEGPLLANVSDGIIQVNGQGFTTSNNLSVVAGALLNWMGNLRLDGLQSLSSQPGGMIRIATNLLGNTINVDRYTPQGTLSFPSGTHLMEAMSADVGDVPTGYVDNFAYGLLVLESGAQVMLVNQATNSPGASQEAVYVNSLIVSPNSVLNLNGLHLYTHLAQFGGSVTNGTISQSPNNTGVLLSGSSLPGSISTAGQLDAYTFYGRAGHYVAVAVDTGSAAVVPPPLSYAYVQLLDPSTNVIASGSNTVAQQTVALLSVPLTVDGTYTVQVRAPGNHASSTGNFLVTIWDVTPNIGTLTLDKQLNGTIETPYSVDLWNFSAVANQQVRFHLLNASSPGVVFDLKGPSGWIGFTNLAGDSDLITLPTSGSYTMTARGTGGAYGINYAFMMEQVVQTTISAGSSISGQLVGNGQAQLYRVDVTNAGPMRISLSLGAGGGLVELYAQLGSPPTRGTYDSRYQGSASAQFQQIVIPYASVGSWYILVYGNFVPQLTTFTLGTELKTLFVQNASPPVSGSVVDTTLYISGAGFDLNTIVQLSANGTNFPAATVNVSSATNLSAIFPSNSVPAGIYAVCVSSLSDQDCLTNAFTMVAGGLPDFHADIVVPSFIGYHHIATIYVEYSNQGTAAMPAPLLTVTATQNGRSAAFLTLDKNILVDNFWSSVEPQGFTHSVQLLASGATPGVLQPGESFRVPVYYGGWQQPWDFSYPPIQFTVGTHQADSTDPIDWTSYATNTPPAGLTSAQWNTLLSEIEVRFGSTWGSYVSALDQAVAWTDPVDAPAYDAGELFSILTEQIIGSGNCGLSGSLVDVTTNQVVTNAQVVARQSSTLGESVVRTTQTDVTGHFTFTNLPPGSYSVAVEGYLPAGPDTYALNDGSAISNIVFDVFPIPQTNSPYVSGLYTNDAGPALVTDSAGVPHLLWQHGTEIWHAYNDGTNWVTTGSLPGAAGGEPVAVAASNLVDGTSSGIMVGWQTVSSNGGSLYFTVVKPTNGVNAWVASAPTLLNETNQLDNDGLALVVQPNGRPLAVWQKRSLAYTDDEDLYFHALLVQSSQLVWPTNALLGSDNPPVPGVVARESEGCVGIGFDTGDNSIPDWVPILGGHYKGSFQANWCGTGGCKPTRGGSGQFDLETPRTVFGAKFGGKAAWKTESQAPSGCQYVFDSASVNGDLHASLDVPAYYFPFKYAKLIIGSTWGVTFSEEFTWNKGNFPAWPDEGEASLEVEAGIYGKANLYVPLVGVVEGKISGTGSLTGKVKVTDGDNKWSYQVGVKIEGELSKNGWFSVHYSHEWKAPDDESSVAHRPLDTDSDIVITLSPLVGTTNVYSGTPVLSNVQSNVVQDGKPALALVPGGATYLAWTLDSEAPTNWLGNRVLVGTFGTTNWGAPIEVPGTRGFNSDVQLAVDSLNRPMLAWAMASSAGLSLSNSVSDVENAMGSNVVVYSIYNGSQWSSPVPVATLSGTESSVALGHGPGGIVASWINDANNIKSLYAATWNGSAWSSPLLVATGEISGPVAIGTVSGVATVFWTQDFDTDTNGVSDLSLVSSSFDTKGLAWTSPQVFSPVNGKAEVAKPSSVVANDLFALGTPPPECCPTNPPPPPGPPNSSCVTNCGGGASQSVGPQDPNAKIGPGFGTFGYVPPDTLLPYRIEFENSTNATSPAQEVFVTDYLNSNFDWTSFQLAEIGFGNVIISIPPNSQYYETNVPMSYNGSDFDVEIEAGVDLSTGEVFANFYSIDPETDLPPPVTSGFLPPEDGTGRGDGYVSYFVRPKAALPTGTQITNVATIVFDLNPAIATDQVDPHDPSKGIDTNKLALITIDGTPPQSSVHALPAVESNAVFSVCWSGTDSGSGIASYDIYVQTNSGPWAVWLAGTTNSCALFTGQNSTNYGFYSIARDNVGNVEAPPAVAEAGTTVLSNSGPAVTIVSPTNNQSFAVSNIVVSGTAAPASSSGKNISAVKVKLNNGAWQSAKGTNSWSLGVKLASGTNTITAQCQDSGGKTSSIVSIIVTFKLPDNAKPSVVITSPTKNQLVTNAFFVVKGTASDNVGVTNVWCQVNGNPWLSATSSNLWKNWSASVQLMPGTNTVRAFSQDSSGNPSATSSVPLVYGVTLPVTVRISGEGRLTPNYNGQSLQIGNVYQMAAAGTNGFALTNWSGGTPSPFSVLTNGSTLRFVMQSNLTLQANFVDVTKPTLTVVAPTSNQRWSNAVFTVRGTAKDNAQVAAVWVLTNGVWGLASTANGWTNWSMDISPVPRTNVLQAYAQDTAGNRSVTNSVKFYYVMTDRLTVLTTGKGSVSPIYSNSVIEIGATNQMTATAGSGDVFSNWMNNAGVVLTNGRTLRFTMQSNLVLTANFIPNPFVPIAGTYQGLFYNTDAVEQASSGSFSGTVNSNGLFTAKFQQGLKSIPVSGQFSLTGAWSTNALKSWSNAAIWLQLDLSGGDLISGNISNAFWTAELAADRAIYSKSNPAPQIGKYTLVLPGSTNANVEPAGNGYGTVSVDTNGNVTFNGTLGEGTKVTQSAIVSKNAQWGVYIPLYSGQGSLIGWLTFTNEPDSDLNGVLNWIKPAHSATNIYPNGFTNQTEAIGSHYMFASGSRALDLTNGLLILEYGNLAGSVANEFTLGTNNVGTGTNGLSLTISNSTGLFQGSVTNPATGKVIKYNGVILQKLDSGYGAFQGTNQTGGVLLQGR